MTNTEQYPLVEKIIDYEQGELSDDDTVVLFQHLVNTGLAWTLQGHYGRTATDMIEDGSIIPPHNGSK